MVIAETSDNEISLQIIRIRSSLQYKENISPSPPKILIFLLILPRSIILSIVAPISLYNNKIIVGDLQKTKNKSYMSNPLLIHDAC